MKIAKYTVVGAAAFAMLAAGHVVIAQDAGDRNLAPDISSQGSASAPRPPIAGQGSEDDRTLEIAPQTGVNTPRPAVQEIPAERKFRPDDTASIDRGFNPNTENDLNNRPHKPPYLGISVQYTTKCYKGGEEQGLEIMTVDPNSPAAAAGLHAPSGPTVMGATAATLSTILPIVGTIVTSQLDKGGQLGLGGDLIVGVDGHRIHNEQEFREILSRMKPGDTLYLNIIRPLMGGAHGPTMTVAVHVGAVGEPVANAMPPIHTSPPGAESYAH